MKGKGLRDVAPLGSLRTVAQERSKRLADACINVPLRLILKEKKSSGRIRGTKKKG